MARYIFVTGGVVSSLGKGLSSASLAYLLQSRGYKVRLRKLDPYLNVDPGTMSPFQHGEVYVTEDDYELPNLKEFKATNTTSLSSYYNAVIPAFEKLKKEGKIDHWGIGLGQEEALIKAINHEQPPDAMQCVVNILNSNGAIGYISKKPNPNLILEECQNKNIPILAIRAVQAGALTSSMDRKPNQIGRAHV